MTAIRRTTEIIVAIGLMIGAGTALADTVATPCSYKVESANSKFFAVVFAPEKAKKYECISQGPEKKKEADQLRRNYPSSGVYELSSSKPAWTFDWWAY